MVIILKQAILSIVTTCLVSFSRSYIELVDLLIIKDSQSSQDKAPHTYSPKKLQNR